MSTYYLKSVRTRPDPAPDPVIAGQVGVWQNVTPGGIDLDMSHFGADNFGVQGAFFAPVNKHICYAPVDYQGLWRSTNYGLTWAKRDTDGKLDTGKNWVFIVAPDESYLLAGSGNNFTAGAFKVWRSTDGGLTWSGSADLSDTPYGFDIDPNDPLHAICTTHGDDKFYESADGGRTWTDRGSVTGGGVSGLAQFITSTSVLFVGQTDSGAAGVRIGTKSGGSWSWVKTSTREHPHGTSQAYIDRVNGLIFLANATDLVKSADGGATWTTVSSQFGSVVVSTPTRLYAGASFGFPHLQSAPAPAGTSWADDTNPTGMDNGPKNASVSTDGVKHVLVYGCWWSGIWRYVEP